MLLPSSFRDRQTTQLQMIGKHLRENCKTCNGEGTVSEVGFNLAKICPDCMGKFEKVKKYIYAGLSPEHLRLKLATVEYAEETKKKVEKIISGFSLYIGQLNLIFHNVNSKFYSHTPAGIILLRQYIQNNIGSFYMDFSILIDHFLAFSDKDKEAILKYCSEVPVLMIDNFCNGHFKAETKEGFLFQNIEKILRTRIGKGLTILATSLSREDLHSNYKLLSPILTATYQPVNLYHTTKETVTEAVNKMPDQLKAIFKNELTKSEPINDTLLKLTDKKKSSIDDITRR